MLDLDSMSLKEIIARFDSQTKKLSMVEKEKLAYDLNQARKTHKDIVDTPFGTYYF